MESAAEPGLFAAGQDDSPSIVLTGVRLVNAPNGSSQPTTVKIRGDRVVALGDTLNSRDIPIHLGGCWVTAGLVDLHAHITFDAREHYRARGKTAQDPAFFLTRAVQNLTEAARNGICLVRDAGSAANANIVEIKATLEEADAPLPEIVASGPPLCVPDGHGVAFGQCIPPNEDLFTTLSKHQSAGHEWLKVMNGPEVWPDDDLNIIVDVAHSVGLRVAVHAFTAEGIRGAVMAGADTVEHGAIRDRALAQRARANGTQFVPTIYCSWISLHERFVRTQPPNEIQHLRHWRSYLLECLPDHLSMGLSLLPGTDAGCAPCSSDDYIEELLELERIGMDPARVIHSATTEAARLLGRGEQYGSIAAGKLANLIVTREDPTRSVAHLKDPLLVFLKGVDVKNGLGNLWN